jgi:PhzF family phenazine biosynthesis protein
VTQKIYQVDAFSPRPFAGNPAAVCILSAPRDDAWMQAVANEMNLSETAFLCPRAEGFDLRWFTPAVEVHLCGHATLASAHVLWEQGVLAREARARFLTRSGLLTADLRGDWIEMDFPATPPQETDAPQALIEGLGAEARYVGRTSFDYFVELEDAETVRRLGPDLRALRSLDARGIIVTAPSDDRSYDFVSRFFAPGAGIDEDPVTGSAHCALGPYWSTRLGRAELTGFQASRRGGVVRVRPDDGRVFLAGQAVTVYEATLSGAC